MRYQSLDLDIVNRQQWVKQIFDNLDISETSRKDYQYRIGEFIKFVQNNGFNQDSFLQFKRYLNARTDWSISTRNKYLICAKILLKEMHRQQMLPVDVTSTVKCFRQSKKHKVMGLSSDEVSRIIEHLNSQTQNYAILRLKAMFYLLAYQGLRQVEITRLDITDLDLLSMRAYIRGKGQDDKERIYLHPMTNQALQKYLKAHKLKGGPLFTSISNHTNGKRLSVRGLRNLITRLFAELNIDKNVHGARHWFTTQLIQSYKGDLLEVANYTRHKSIETLQIYNDQVLQEADLERFYSTFAFV